MVRPARAAPPAPDLAAREAALGVVEAALARRGGLEAALEQPPFAALDERERAFARMLAMTLLRRMGAIDARLAARLQQAAARGCADAAPSRRRPGALSRDAGLRRGRHHGPPRRARPRHPAVQGADQRRAARPAARPRRRRRPGDARARLAVRALADRLRRGRGARHRRPDRPGAGDRRDAARVGRWPGAGGRTGGRASAGRLAAHDAARRRGRLAGLRRRTLVGAGRRGGHPRPAGRRPPRPDGARSLRRAGRQDAAAGRRRRSRDRRRSFRRAARARSPDPSRAPALRPRSSRPTPARGATRATSTRSSSTRPARQRAPSAAIPTCSGARDRATSRRWRRRRAACSTPPPARVAAGGRLVYCVCSLEPEEGEAQARGFLARHPAFAVSPIRAGEGGAPAASVAPTGMLRILPHPSGRRDGRLLRRPLRPLRLGLSPFQRHVEGAGAAVPAMGLGDARHHLAQMRLGQPLRRAAAQRPVACTPWPVTTTAARWPLACASSRKRVSTRRASSWLSPCRSRLGCGAPRPRAMRRSRPGSSGFGVQWCAGGGGAGGGSMAGGGMATPGRGRAPSGCTVCATLPHSRSSSGLSSRFMASAGAHTGEARAAPGRPRRRPPRRGQGRDRRAPPP